MTGERLNAAIARLRAHLKGELGRRVVWLTDGRRDAFGDVSTVAALVTVLGREHYAERRKSYPVRSWRDLSRVLTQELLGAPATLTVIGPVIDDRREVAFFALSPAMVGQLGRTLWVVPESLALCATLPAQRVAIVERHGLRYFLASSGVSQIAGGAVRTAALFAMAAGLDSEQETLALGEQDANMRLLQGLRRLPAGAWARLLRPGLSLDPGLAWRPLGTLAAAGLAAYLVLGSVYLSVTQTLRERELKSLGPEVATLLDSQRRVEKLSGEQRAIATVLSDRHLTYPLWRVAARAWQKGASIAGVALVDGRVTLRGTAPVATDVLGALAADPGVADARFAAPVRQSGVREEFVITLKLTGKGNDG